MKDSHHCHVCNYSLTKCISWIMCSYVYDLSLYQALHTLALVLGDLLPSNFKLSKMLTGSPYCYFTYCQNISSTKLACFIMIFTIHHFTPKINGATFTLAAKLYVSVMLLLLSVGYKSTVFICPPVA